MAAHCPRCYAELPEDATWVCPTCGYTLRTPAVAKLGLVIMLFGLVLVGVYLAGPQNVIPRNGWVPYDLVDLTIANFALLALGTILLGMFLTAIGGFVVRNERLRVAA